LGSNGLVFNAYFHVTVAAIACGFGCDRGGQVGEIDVGVDSNSYGGDAKICHGNGALCDKRFDQVVFPTTHNAMSNADDGWDLPVQRHNLIRQLDDGIRGFLIDVHVYNGDDDKFKGKAMLCHQFCALGSRDLTEAWTAMRAWLDAHPNEVITFVIEDYVDETLMTQALTVSGLVKLTHHQPQGQPWPTLHEMIAKNERVFIMLESGSGKALWRHGYQDFAWDTNFANEKPSDFSCKLLRGKATNKLFLLNHFLTKGLNAHDSLAQQVNHDPLLVDRLKQCQKEANQLPNFVAVDYYDVGDLFGAVATMNANL